MALKDVFSVEAERRKDIFSKTNPTTLLHIQFVDLNHRAESYYDFLTRQKFSLVAGELQATPFSQLDPEVLECLRDKLIEHGGNPPELPANDLAELRSHAIAAEKQRRMKEKATSHPIPG
jgi:hypothetical protein